MTTYCLWASSYHMGPSGDYPLWHADLSCRPVPTSGSWRNVDSGIKCWPHCIELPSCQFSRRSRTRMWGCWTPHPILSYSSMHSICEPKPLLVFRQFFVRASHLRFSFYRSCCLPGVKEAVLDSPESIWREQGEAYRTWYERQCSFWLNLHGVPEVTVNNWKCHVRWIDQRGDG